MNVLKEIQKLLNYLYNDEKKSWEEENCPKDHTFLTVQKVWAFVNKPYQVIAFHKRGVFEQAFSDDLNMLMLDMDNIEDNLCPKCRDPLVDYKCKFCQIDWSNWSYQQIVNKLNS